MLAALGELTSATGVAGMVGGQYVDVTQSELDADALRALHALKTGRLISSSVGVVLVLEGVSNADNVGGVFRNAAAFGVRGVLLSPTCCDPLYRKAIRTSMGAVLRVPFARLDDWPAGLTPMRGAGFTIAALTPRAPSETLDAFAARPRPERLALLVGTEGAGLTLAAESAADHRVRIPIDERVDSLNVAVAVGIALYALSRR